MRGPFRPGTRRCAGLITHWERCVVRGRQYRVIKEFDDADGAYHCVGEEWFILGSFFVPYDETLTIVIAASNGDEWEMPLCWRPELQSDVCENFTNYVEQTDAPLRDDYFSSSICADCHAALQASTPKRCAVCGAVWE